MAPEQVRGAALSAATDWYAFGVLASNFPELFREPAGVR